MLAISIRQPWAWLILHAGKDIENRGWPTRVRGRVLVHAAKSMTRNEHEGAVDFIVGAGMPPLPFDLPAFKHLQRGGIVGSVEIVDCVREHSSAWFVGRFGFVLRNPQPLVFTPYKGRLGFFDVPDLPVREMPDDRP